MTKNEFGIFAAAIRTYYPKEQILPNKEAMALWYRELQDIPYQVAEAALRKWVATNKWSPSIAEIREMTVNVTHGEALTWGESWEMAVAAIRRFGSYRPKEALESLDPLTRKCVESLGYRELCISENPMADRANYRMVFETYAKRQQTEQQMALPLQEAIKQIQLQSGDGLLQIGGGSDV